MTGKNSLQVIHDQYNRFIGLYIGGGAMHVLLDDDIGRLTVRRLRPWHRWLARGLAARLDRRLAEGVPPEASAILAARATFLTAVQYRRALAASLRRLLGAARAVRPAAR